MKLYMPVFVYVQTVAETEIEREVEVKILVSLPPDYQELKSDPAKTPLEPPKPNDPDIFFEVLDEFKGYIRYFITYKLYYSILVSHSILGLRYKQTIFDFIEFEQSKKCPKMLHYTEMTC